MRVRSTRVRGRGPSTTPVKLVMSSRTQRGQTTPTSHPLDPEEEGPKNGDLKELIHDLFLKC